MEEKIYEIHYKLRIGVEFLLEREREKKKRERESSILGGRSRPLYCSRISKRT